MSPSGSPIGQSCNGRPDGGRGAFSRGVACFNKKNDYFNFSGLRVGRWFVKLNAYLFPIWKGRLVDADD